MNSFEYGAIEHSTQTVVIRSFAHSGKCIEIGVDKPTANTIAFALEAVERLHALRAEIHRAGKECVGVQGPSIHALELIQDHVRLRQFLDEMQELLKRKNDEKALLQTVHHLARRDWYRMRHIYQIAITDYKDAIEKVNEFLEKQTKKDLEESARIYVQDNRPAWLRARDANNLNLGPQQTVFLF